MRDLVLCVKARRKSFREAGWQELLRRMRCSADGCLRHPCSAALVTIAKGLVRHGWQGSAYKCPRRHKKDLLVSVA